MKQKRMGSQIKKVIITPALFEYAVERGEETASEVGFFLVGLIDNSVAYVHDLIEFDYDEKTPISVKSGIEIKAILSSAIPIGLRLLGNMHKHPGFLEYSGTDRDNYLQYASSGRPCVFLIYQLRPTKVQAYTVNNGNIKIIEHEIRELEEKEKIRLFDVDFPVSLKVAAPTSTKMLYLKLKMLSEMDTHIRNRMFKPLFRNGNRVLSDDETIPEITELEVEPLYPIDVCLGINQIPYRLFFEHNSTVKELREKLMKVFNYPPEFNLFSENLGLVKENQNLKNFVGDVLFIKVGISVEKELEKNRRLLEGARALLERFDDKILKISKKIEDILNTINELESRVSELEKISEEGDIEK